MKKKDDMSELERLKKKEDLYSKATAISILSGIGCLVLAFTLPLIPSKKIDDLVESTGYNAYRQEMLAEYEEQYRNGEISWSIYKGYQDHYNLIDTFKGYLKENGYTAEIAEYDSLNKWCYGLLFTPLTLSFISCITSLGCVMAGNNCRVEQLETTSSASGGDDKYKYPDIGVIFPEYSDEKDIEKN